MKDIKLLRAIGGVDDALLEEYEQDTGTPQRTKSRHWMRWGAMAACLCLVIAAAFTVPELLKNDVLAPAQHAQDSTVIGEKDAYGPGDILPEDRLTIINGSGYSEDSAACYAAPKAGDILYFIEVRAAMEEHAGSDVKLFVGIDLMSDIRTLSEHGTEVETEIQRMRGMGYDVFFAEAWTYEGDGEKVPYTYLAGLFTVDELKSFQTSADYGYAFRFAHNGDGACVEYNRSDSDSTVQIEVRPITVELTLKEAYDEIGGLLPSEAPVGFAFESAYRSGDSVSVLWTNGYNDLRWKVSDYTEADEARLTSTGDKENYDLALYPIPRADSVPDELREIVDDPIFDISELTMDVVNARAYLADDQGDTDGYRMRFSVRYGDIVVEVNCKGVSPEWVYQQLVSIEH